MDPTTRAALRLAKAVLIQGFKDARRGDREAVRWLWSQDGALFIAATGRDPDHVGEAIERVLAGLPLRR